MKRTIYNPFNHQFEDKKLQALVEENISLACEFIDSDKERNALERNNLEGYVLTINTIMRKLLDLSEKGKTKELEETIRSYMTGYL